MGRGQKTGFWSTFDLKNDLDQVGFAALLPNKTSNATTAISSAISSDERNTLVDIFGDAGLEIWDIFAARLVSADEEKRFRKYFETATLTFEASCPISTAEKLLALHVMTFYLHY